MNEDKLLIGIILIVVAYLLTRSPKCNHGCNTIAEHLFKYGAVDLAEGLLG
jgi:hypothetical protein